MSCLRCGKETEGKAVFCPECLAEMEQYPVKPGTLIHIPHRQDADSKKPVKKRRELSPEEQLENAKTMIQALFATALGLLGALIIAGFLLIFTFSTMQNPPESTQPPVGRNYTAIDPTN